MSLAALVQECLWMKSSEQLRIYHVYNIRLRNMWLTVR